MHVRVSDIQGIPTLSLEKSNHGLEGITEAVHSVNAGDTKSLRTSLANIIKRVSSDISLRRSPGLETGETAPHHPWETDGLPAIRHRDALKIWKNFASEFRRTHPLLDEQDEQEQADEAWKEAHRKLRSC
jgi:hypothetical protein